MRYNLDLFPDIHNTNKLCERVSHHWQSMTSQLTVASLIIWSSLSLWLFSEDASSVLLKNRTNVPRDVACSIPVVRLLTSLIETYIRETDQWISLETHASSFLRKSTVPIPSISVSFIFEKIGWRFSIRAARFAKPWTLSEVSWAVSCLVRSVS